MDERLPGLISTTSFPLDAIFRFEEIGSALTNAFQSRYSKGKWPDDQLHQDPRTTHGDGTVVDDDKMFFFIIMLQFAVQLIIINTSVSNIYFMFLNLLLFCYSHSIFILAETLL